MEIQVESTYGLNQCQCIDQENKTDKKKEDTLVEKRDGEFLIEEGQLSLETARFNVNGKILSYEEFKKMKEEEKLKQGSSSSQ